MKSVQISDTVLQVLDQGQGPVLLLVHGFPLDHTMWSGQWPEFASTCRVLVPDLRGFGGSGTAPDILTMERLADDLHELLVALDIHEPVVFVGLSMGGYVAWQFLQRHRASLAALVMCDTRAAADTETVAQGRRYLAERVMSEGMRETSDELIQKLFASETLDRSPDRVQKVREVMNRTQPKTVAAALLGMAQRPDVSALLPEVDCPTLVLCGRADQLTPLAEMEAMAKQMPQATFQGIDDAGHMAPLENPTAVNQAIGKFLPEAIGGT